MNYEKAYKEALERAKDCCVNKKFSELEDTAQQLCEYVFPELRESEDERIRKRLISYFKGFQSNAQTYWEGLNIDKIIAWLEKQKRLTTDEDKQGKEDVLWCIEQARKNAKDENDMGTCWLAEKWLEKQGENKPIEQDTENRDLWEYIKEWKDKFGRLPKDDDELAACIDFVMKRQKPSRLWSEEDEEMRLDTIRAFQLAYPYATEEENPRKRNIDWLKSLKPNHWKPSEEQLKALKNTIIGKRGPLYDLYFDLEKL